MLKGIDIYVCENGVLWRELLKRIWKRRKKNSLGWKWDMWWSWWIMDLRIWSKQPQIKINKVLRIICWISQKFKKQSKILEFLNNLFGRYTYVTLWINTWWNDTIHRHDWKLLKCVWFDIGLSQVYSWWTGLNRL